MEIVDLPFPLRTKTNQEVPSAVQDRLAYLWKASTCALNARIEGDSNEPLDSVSASSHRLSKSFMEAVKAHKVELPLLVTERLCGQCSVLLIPSVTCQMRLRPRSRRSKVNKSGKDKLKNQLVLRCNKCNNVSKAPGFIKRTNPTPLHATNGGKVAEAEPANTSLIKSSSTKSLPEKAAPAVAPKKGFSFLSKLSTSSSSTSDLQRRAATAPVKADSKDFISFSSSLSKPSALTQANNSNLQALSKGMFGRGGLGGAAPLSSAPSTGTLNLLELEALNKKKKRKSMGGGSI